MKNDRPGLPQLTRRDLFRVGGVTVAGHSLLPLLRPFNVHARKRVQPRGTAEVCIFYFLQGAMSHVDTFDLKEGKWTPEDLDIRTASSGIKLPHGLYPRLSQRMERLALIRSMAAWTNLHSIGQYYLQVGHPLSPARVKEMPHVGSVIGHEYEARRKDSDFLPPFVALNFGTTLVGPGVFPASCAGMVADTEKTPPFVMKEEEQELFKIRRELLARLDQSRMGPSERGRLFEDYANHYKGAYRLFSTPGAPEIFQISDEERKRYGETPSGDACVVARNLVRANAGTRFILIGQNGWDLHGDAWKKDDKGNFVAEDSAQRKLCLEMDGALSGLLDDLASMEGDDGRSLLEKTFVVCMGEFGRTPGNINGRGGRDHHIYAHTGLFAGAGVAGGKVIGGTDEIGSLVSKPDWHGERPIYPEDVLATIYSVMGVDWEKKITDTPSGRPFYYIEDVSPLGVMDFDEISELFS